MVSLIGLRIGLELALPPQLLPLADITGCYHYSMIQHNTLR